MLNRLLVPLLVGLLVTCGAPLDMVEAQASVLADALPEAGDLSQPVTVVDEGGRSLDEIASGFPDPAGARLLLIESGWQENAYRTFAADESAEAVRSIDVSLHQFSTEADALLALPYFANGRADVLRLTPVEVPVASLTTLAISGFTADGPEVTLYLVADQILARITVHGPESVITAYAVSTGRAVADRVLGHGTYISPTFGYEIDWRRAYWPDAESTSTPGIGDDFVLEAGDVSLSYQGRMIDLPDRSHSDWANALQRELAAFALDRADPHVGATVEIRDSSASVRYRDESGTLWTEYIAVFPLLANEGLVFSTFAYPDGYEWTGARPPGLVDENFVAAADDLVPPAPPGKLNDIAGQTYSIEQLTAAMPLSVQDLDLIAGPRDEAFPWAILGQSTQFDYADATDPSRTATINIAMLMEPSSSTPTIRRLLNCCGLLEVIGADVHPEAAVPFFVGTRLVWTLPGTDWLVTITPPTADEAEALLNALVANLMSQP